MFEELEPVTEQATKPKGKGKGKAVEETPDMTEHLLKVVQNLQAELEAMKSQQVTQPTPAPVVQDMSVVRALQNQQVQQRFRGFNHHMVNAPRRTLRIPKAYQRFFGNYIVSGINGNTVSVPIDGREHEVSVFHYDDILNKMARVDELYARQGSEVIRQDRQGTI